MTPKSKPTETTSAEQAAPQSNRETVESIVVAVILAFLFRTFVAEAFVIPTGSMAPTLMGNHKDVACEKCGFRYQGGASSENEDRVGGDSGTIAATTCPLCRYTMTLDWKTNPNQATFTGDRILVSKFSYDLSEPERWDVIVFKYPGNAKINYIKRLVGLPNETIMIKHGDIYVRRDGEERFLIARKPPEKQFAMMQPLDDTDHTASIPDLARVDWPSRWQYFPEKETLRPCRDDQQGLVIDGTNDTAWVRYRHLLPDATDWNQIESGDGPVTPENIAGELVSDFCQYNAVVKERRMMPDEFRIEATKRYQIDGEQTGLNWVGDLAFETAMTIEGDQGEVMLDLVEGGVHFYCSIDVATGRAALSTSDEGLAFDDGQPVADTSIRGKGTYRLRYSNFDDEIRLWINGSLVKFAKPATYGGDPNRNVTPIWSAEDPGDLQPIGMGATGVSVRVSHLKVWRDIYYIAGQSDYDEGVDNRVRRVFRSPETWSSERLFRARRQEEYPLDSNQFFPLGDNSPQSADGRLWFPKKYVDRDMLIGKATVVYWPHSWNRPIPFLPNIPKMRLIH